MLFRKIPETSKDAFLGSLSDYLLYVLAISPLYPLTLSPGEVAIILAVFVAALAVRQQPQPSVQPSFAPWVTS
jgi:hypothetical protein